MRYLLLFLVFAGCTTLTDEQRYARDNALAIAKDRFQEVSRACRATGGYMVVTRPIREMRNWSKWDYQSARCATHKIY